MIPAAAYARDSSEMQAQNGLSIPAQLDEIRDYAKKNGYEIIEEYVDDGLTGKDDQRPAFREMTALIRSRRAPYKAVICWKSDRFARNTENAAAFRGILRREGIDLVCVAEPNIEGPVGNLVNVIMDGINEFYSNRLAEDTLRGGKQAAKQGYAQGGTAPYGMKKESVLNENGARRVKYAPDPDTAPIVRRIYQEYADGKSMMDIAKGLAKDGIPTQRGGKWNSTHIHKILTHHQKIYLGCIVYNRTKCIKRGRTARRKDESEWIVTPGAHEPIITKELAQAANHTRTSRPAWQNPNRNAQDGESRNILLGLISCGVCGNRFTATRSGGSIQKYRHRYYCCIADYKTPLRDFYSRCPGNIWVRADRLEGTIESLVKRRISSPTFMQDFLAALDSKKQAHRDDREKRIRTIQQQIDRIEKKQMDLVDMMTEGDIPRNLGKTKMQELAGTLNALNSELADARAMPETNPINENLSHLADIDMTDFLSDPKGLRSLYEALIEKIVITPARAMTRWNILWPEERIHLRTR